MSTCIGKDVVATLLLLVGIMLSGCGPGTGGGFLGDKEEEQTANEAALSDLPFPVYRKTKMTADFLSAVPDGDDPTSDWMVKLDDTWSKQQAESFITAAENAGFAITEKGKQVEILIVVITAPLMKLVTFLKAYPTIEFVEEDEEMAQLQASPRCFGGLALARHGGYFFADDGCGQEPRGAPGVDGDTLCVSLPWRQHDLGPQLAASGA